MTFNFTQDYFSSVKTDLCIFIYTKKNDLTTLFKQTSYEKVLPFLSKTNEISDSSKRLTMFHSPSDDCVDRILFAGCGPSDMTSNSIRHKAGEVAALIRSFHLKSISVVIYSEKQVSSSDFIQSFTEGFTLGISPIHTLKTSDTKKETIPNITFILPSTEKLNTTTKKHLNSLAQTAHINATGQNFARYLANLPGNYLTPELFVDQITKTLKHKKITIKVYNQKDIQKKGMNALYNVGKGSKNPPYLVEIHYNVSKKTAPSILVGKGITFDSGGISLKPSKGMKDMKGDMGGAAAVVGALKALSEQDADCSVIGLVPLAENMPSGDAYKPGDVITSYSGKTIEITNTDAEGRVIMADALSYACTFKPKVIIDIATLTGAACVALGELAAALFGNKQSVIDRFLECYDQTGEQFWQLPLFEGYLNYLKSDVADLINASESRSSGGAITAAKFLEQFVDKTPWLHLDIAPMMRANKDYSYLDNGMSGFSTRSLIYFLKTLK